MTLLRSQSVSIGKAFMSSPGVAFVSSGRREHRIGCQYLFLETSALRSRELVEGLQTESPQGRLFGFWGEP